MNQVSYAPTIHSRQREQFEEIFYPESDGKPMADNTLQFRWIMTIEGNLEVLFRDQPDVFVAGDLLWYPVEGNNQLRQAPDVLVAIGRPKGDRGSYRQWEEDNLPLHVVFEILSPGNRAAEMNQKFKFYERYGVEEYYIYDPDRGKLKGWLRHGSELSPIDPMAGWVSPRLGIRFELVEGELALYHPTGEQFIGYVELASQREHEHVWAEAQLILSEARTEQEQQAKERALQQVEQERRAKEHERLAKEQALQHAEQEWRAKEQERRAKEQERRAKELALQQAEQERQAKEQALQQAEQERQRANSLELELARLRAELARK